jgi:hypothetical protein
MRAASIVFIHGSLALSLSGCAGDFRDSLSQPARKQRFTPLGLRNSETFSCKAIQKKKSELICRELREPQGA